MQKMRTTWNPAASARPFYSALYYLQKRQNDIVKLIKKAAEGRWTMLEKYRVVGIVNLCPNLVIQKGKDIIIDVTVPFDNGLEAFKEASRLKEEKYRNLATELSCNGTFMPLSLGHLVHGIRTTTKRSEDYDRRGSPKWWKRLSWVKLLLTLVMPSMNMFADSTEYWWLPGLRHIPILPLYLYFSLVCYILFYVVFK